VHFFHLAFLLFLFSIFHLCIDFLTIFFFKKKYKS
jgi:hypothetical protein